MVWPIDTIYQERVLSFFKVAVHKSALNNLYYQLSNPFYKGGSTQIV
jgi:hypothetical protein